MTSAARHPREEERLEALRACRLLDTPSEQVYDRMVRLAAGICQTPVALVSLVDEERQWFKAVWGLEIRETPRAQAFCAHAILGRELLVVENALLDRRFADNELVTGEPKIRFYAGVPIRAAGMPIGTLCVIDRRTRRLSDRQREALALLAREVESQITLRQAWTDLTELSHRSASLAAMVVHDMNSPLCVASTLTSWLMSNRELSDDVRSQVADIQDAVACVQRMASDLLDVALGDEGRLQPRLSSLDPVQLFSELGQMASLRSRVTGHSFVADLCWAGGRFVTDGGWVKRVATNFIENAFKYSPSGTRVRLELSGGQTQPMQVRVLDDGPGVPAADRDHIFEKHFRLDRDQLQGRPGAGLGLAFCKLAVETLGGTLGVEANGPRGSVFWFSLPSSVKRAEPPFSETRGSASVTEALGRATITGRA